MRKIIRLARREYMAAVKTKGFIIGLILAPILMSGGFIVLKLSESRVDTTDKKMAVIDHTGLIAEAIIEASKARSENDIYDRKTGKKTGPASLIEIVTPNFDNLRQQRLELSDRIRKGDLYAFVEIGKDVVHPAGHPPGPPAGPPQPPRIAYHSENSALDELRRWVAWPINNQLRKLRLADAGIEESQVKDLFTWVPVEGLGLASLDEATGNVKDAERSKGVEAIGIPIFMIMLIYMMLIMGAQPLMNSVMEEKNQRIAEVLLGSIQPFEFMMGKLLGGVGVALTASSVYIVGGIVSVKYMGLVDSIPYGLIPWYFGYLILALFMYGSIFAALGSACSDSKDVQSLALPAMLPLIFCMFLLGPVLKEPMSDFSTWVSLFPLFTPLIMLFRQSTPGGVPLWQPCVGIVNILALAIVSVWAGGRIFRIGILMQGASPKLRNIIRWVIRG